MLMEEAERIAKEEHGSSKIAVIAGVVVWFAVVVAVIVVVVVATASPISSIMEQVLSVLFFCAR